MRQGNPIERLRNMAHLGLRGFHELPANRSIEKQVAYLKRRSDRTAARNGIGDLTTVDLQFHARVGVGDSTAQHKVTNFGDRSQRLPTKPQRGDTEKIVRVVDLARGVTVDRQSHLIGRNPTTVVGNPDQIRPPLFDVDIDARRPGINRVLHQFFDHTGRALNHLTGGDLIDDPGRELLNPIHP